MKEDRHDMLVDLVDKTIYQKEIDYVYHHHIQLIQAFQAKFNTIRISQ